MRLVVALFALVTALAAGLWLGWEARRRIEYQGIPARPARPPAVDGALRAWAEGDRTKLQSSLAEARALASAAPSALPAEVQAEIRFLEAVATGVRRQLGAVAAEEDGWPASARARWTLIGQTRNPETRRAMREAFARAYPHAWVLADEGGSGGP